MKFKTNKENLIVSYSGELVAEFENGCFETEDPHKIAVLQTIHGVYIENENRNIEIAQEENKEE